MIKEEDAVIRLQTVDAISAERVAQNAQWGGRDHDDTHTQPEWLGFIEEQVDKCEREVHSRVDFTNEAFEREAGQVVRRRLVKIAALAIAGIESIDRKAAQ